MDRRDFLMAGAAAASVGVPAVATPAAPASAGVPARLRYFDYRGVTLHRGRFLDQLRAAREAYYGMADDDMLKGFRRNAGLPAPGNDMGGWARHDSSGTFGQWLSGMARMSRALGDAAMRDKAVGLGLEWQKAAERPFAGGEARRYSTYTWDKTFQGLLDLVLYADEPRFLEPMAAMVRWGLEHMDRTRPPVSPADRDGRGAKGTLEWYTLGENPLRAYQLTGDRAFLELGRLWDYPEFWGKLAASSRPAGVAMRHCYSHVNSLSSAAMFHAVTGDPRYLATIRNGYDWLRGTQTFASGGYGPGEWTMEADGSLGRSLESRLDSAEIPCGAWAGFKLSRYLTGFTGEARYGDWVETLLYNGIGAALPLQPDGRAFYYADYRLVTAFKTYFWDAWPCCSGTLIQTLADYHNILYQHDDDGLYVSQYVPSEVRWEHRGQAVVLTTDTRYPDEEDEVRLRLAMPRPATFALRLRVPAWCDDAEVSVNGAAVRGRAAPNQWWTVSRVWRDGDTVTLRLPQRLRLAPIDAQHPLRVAVMHGPLQMAQDARHTWPIAGAPEEVLANLSRVATAPGEEMRFHWTRQQPFGMTAGPVADLTPLYTMREKLPYRSYFDLDRLRVL